MSSREKFIETKCNIKSLEELVPIKFHMEFLNSIFIDKVDFKLVINSFHRTLFVSLAGMNNYLKMRKHIIEYDNTSDITHFATNMAATFLAGGGMKGIIAIND